MPAQQPSPAEPEYLQSGGAAPPGRRVRRPVALAAAAAAVAGVVAVGGWAAASLMSTGDQPAEAVPANAIGYLSIDLDPSAAQKIEAVRLLQKFPALREELDISDRDDLRRWAFEQVAKDGACTGVDYDTDVEPWIGERVAMAAVPAGAGGKRPIPLVAVQVTDPAAAASGIEKLAACGDTAEVGVAVVGDYALVSDTQEHADAIAGSVGEGTLAEDPDYRKWTGQVGEPGIVSMYVAPGAMAYLSDMHDRMADELADRAELKDHPGLPGLPAVDMAEMRRQMERLSGDFEGMAAVVRFEDGAVEAEFVGEGMPEDPVGADGQTGITELPADTAVALGASLSDTWADSYEAMTGLPLPNDLDQLLGEGFTLSVDGSPGAAAESQALTALGLRVSGDPAEINDAVDRLRTRFGPMAAMVAVEDGDGVVAMGLDPEYVAELAGRGTLGTQEVYRDVVPDADGAAGTLFVDFDAVQRWAAEGTLPGGRVDQEKLANLEPLRALGFSGWVEDDGSERGLLRLTTD